MPTSALVDFGFIFLDYFHYKLLFNTVLVVQLVCIPVYKIQYEEIEAPLQYSFSSLFLHLQERITDIE